MSKNYLCATKKSPVDLRDWRMEDVFKVSSNKLASIDQVEFDLRTDMKDCRDQGTQGSCVACTGSAIKEYHEKKNVGFTDYMSPQFIYNLREDLSEEGMYCRDLMKILSSIGSVPEDKYPYENSLSPDNISDGLYNLAGQFKISGYAQIYTIDGVKQSLVENGPCLAALPVYNYSTRFWDSTLSSSSNESSETETTESSDPNKDDKLGFLLGGHAIAFVGWTSLGFIVRNSWGSGYGDNGYGIFTWSDFTNGTFWEIWGTVDGNTASNWSDYLNNATRKSSSKKRGGAGILIGLLVTVVIILFVMKNTKKAIK